MPPSILQISFKAGAKVARMISVAANVLGASIYDMAV
jgi:hypothetical protein